MFTLIKKKKSKTADSLGMEPEGVPKTEDGG